MEYHSFPLALNVIQGNMDECLSMANACQTTSFSSVLRPVYPAIHNRTLLEFMIDMEISMPVVGTSLLKVSTFLQSYDLVIEDYVVDRILEVVEYAPKTSGSHSTRPSSSDKTKLVGFVSNVLIRADVDMMTVLGSLVYVERARPHITFIREQSMLERVFLGALIIASKYLNDATLKNVEWAICTGIFSKQDINLIEREFLSVLDFVAKITLDDFMGPCYAMMMSLVQ